MRFRGTSGELQVSFRWASRCFRGFQWDVREHSRFSGELHAVFQIRRFREFQRDYRAFLGPSQPSGVKGSCKSSDTY